MGVVDKNLIRAMIEARPPGHSLPAQLYASQEAFDVDMEVFFHNHWILAGVDADVPEPGDIRRLDIGRSSIIIVRGEDHVIRAFHNVCRHRGAQLVQAPAKSAARLVCPYHSWSYKLDGELVFTPQMGKDFDKSCRGLRPVHLRSVGGLLMVCLADDAPADIDVFDAELTARLAPYDLRNAKIAFETDLIEEGNWKLAVDNNRECYHCGGNHPELSKTFHELDVGFDPAELNPKRLAAYEAHVAEGQAQVAAWEAQGFVSHLAEHMTGCSTLFRTERFAMRGEGESQTLDGKVASRRLLGGLTDKRMGDMHLWTFNSWHHFLSDHAIVTYIIPLAPNRTLARTKWLVHKDAVEGVDYDLQRLTEVWRATNQQDADLVAMAQRGVEARGYAPGPLSAFTERHVDLNMSWYLERLRAFGY